MIETPSFRTWLRSRRRDQDPIGDLARDALADTEWPRGPGSLTRYEDYLVSCAAIPAAIDALREAWRLYRLDHPLAVRPLKEGTPR